VTSFILALLLLAEGPAWKAAGDSPPWSACGRKLSPAGFEKWQYAHNLARTREKMSSSPRGASTWTAEMTSRPPEDGLGRALPPFVTRARAIAWTEHPSPDTVHLVTARWWRGAPGERWVVLVAGKVGPSRNLGTDLIDVRLALVEVTRGSPGEEPTVRRIARTVGPLVPCPDWGVLPEELVPGLEEGGCQAIGIEDSYERLKGLDFGPYRLTPSERAFGLRTHVGEGYGGGFGSFEILTLFRVEGEVLLPILDVPVGFALMVAGSWNRDGTRQHRTRVAELVVEVRPRGAATADLLLRSRRSRQGLVYAWDGQRRAYSCSR
jgi:hypothetical protein